MKTGGVLCVKCNIVFVMPLSWRHEEKKKKKKKSEAGRQGDWNRALCLGNPAADDLVKQYLKAVTAC